MCYEAKDWTMMVLVVVREIWRGDVHRRGGQFEVEQQKGSIAPLTYKQNASTHRKVDLESGIVFI